MDRALLVVVFMLVGAAMLPDKAAAQLGECDHCTDAPWGVMCLLGAGNVGGGIDCYQLEPDECRFRGGECNETVAVNDLTVGGSIGSSVFALASSEATAGDLRRPCDGAVAWRYATRQELEEDLVRLRRIRL